MAEERQENTAGRHVPSIITAMVVLQIVLIATATTGKKLPTARTELGIAFTGFFLLALSRVVPQLASKLAWLAAFAAIMIHISGVTPIVKTLTGATETPTPTPAGTTGAGKTNAQEG